MIFLLFFLLSCSKEAPKQEPIVYPIQKALVKKMDLPLVIDSIGHVDPFNAIDVRARVEGELVKVFFKEGMEVQKGSPLFEIDKRPYQAILDKAEATLNENLANLAIAKERVVRYTSLVKEDYFSELDYDSLVSDFQKTEAITNQNRAEIQTAKLNLDFCSISSPIDGVTSILNVDQGNLITSNSSKALLTIYQIQPIYILFSIPEKELDKLLSQKNKELEVLASYEDGRVFQGKLDLINNAVDPETAMITLRGVFSNEEKLLWPGTFVKTRLIVTTIKDVLVIPQKALQMTTEGPIVFIVLPDNTVDVRKVTLGEIKDDLLIIKEGLQEKEWVVTEGQINLFKGALVK